jgi:ATP/maltotriose-dependent transcriptional regulator MalT
MQLHGAWPEAVEETRRACERLAHAADSYTTGAVLYRQAEIHRTRGDLAAAENAFREATQRAVQRQGPQCDTRSRVALGILHVLQSAGFA